MLVAIHQFWREGALWIFYLRSRMALVVGSRSASFNRRPQRQWPCQLGTQRMEAISGVDACI
jgi:hypothetical protein